MYRSGSRRGSTLVEFTLVGIPMLFTVIALMEISRGMWVYATLAHSVREATRYAIVHGTTCTASLPVCASRVSDIAKRIQNAGVGLAPEQLTVTMSSSTRTVGPFSLSALLSDSTYFPTYAPGTWPQDPGGDPGQLVSVSATYSFASAICLFWPGATKTAEFAAISLPASSQGRIEF